MKFYLTIILLLISNAILIAQSEDETIKEIRRRYYRVNGDQSKLKKVSFDNADYYFYNNKLSIAKSKTDLGEYEFYFDSRYGAYYTYFIYFNPATNNYPELRGYYSDNETLVLFKEGKEEKSFNAFEKNPYDYLIQDARSALNSFFNLYELAKYSNDNRKSTVMLEVKSLEKSIAKSDTIDSYIEDGGSGFTLQFRDINNKKVKTTTSYSGEHGGGVKNEYYLNGRIIYSTDESESGVGNNFSIHAHATYYNKYGDPYREDIIRKLDDSRIYSGIKNDYLFELGEFSDVVPEIKFEK